MPPDLPADLSTELAREATHLAASRAALHAMRERTASLIDAAGSSDVAGDPFSSEALARTLYLRMEQLLDDGATPLFFGRLDHLPDDGPYTGETFHVGRRHVNDATGNPMVVDWRAPVSTAFYRATALDPRGVALRRRFGFAGGSLTSFEDEHLSRGEETGAASRILTEEIERPRVGPMRDIVATIQPDQDALVRADLDASLCIQGAPGTGKTAVGLHRAAYLLYTHRQRLRHSGVLVVGPNTAFLSYIAQVLPALGEVDVRQVTADALAARVPVRASDPSEVARVKGDARMATVLARALDAAITRPDATLMVNDAGTRLRLGPDELARLVDDVRREGLPYAAGRDRVGLRVAERLRRLLERRGESPSDQWVARMARSKAVRVWLDGVWPAADPPSVVARLLGDPAFLAQVAGDVLTEAEQDAMRWEKPPRNVRAARWSAADATLVDEVAGLLDRMPSYGHVIVDEAQDLSPMQARAIARRSRHGSLTVLGDLAQGTAVHAARDWPTLLGHLGKADAAVVPLTRGYRMPAEIVALANRLLPSLASGVAPAESLRRAAGSLSVLPVASGAGSAGAELTDAVVEAVAEALDSEGSIAVITADGDLAAVAAALVEAGIPTIRLDAEESAVPVLAGPAARVTVVPARLAKGLEYDHVVVVEPAAIVDAEPRGLHRLYVVLTRAVSRLVVLHARPLPPQLT